MRESKRQRCPGAGARIVRIPFLLVVVPAFGSVVAAQPDKDKAFVLTKTPRTLEKIEAIHAGMPAVKFAAPADRWQHLPRTAGILKREKGVLRVVMLGDSIVNDTSRSCWELLVERAWPGRKVVKTTCVRGSTGCWWYREKGRVQRYVLDHRPDLLILGGISQRNDLAAIRDVIEQVRKAGPCDVLLMTGAFGRVDPRDEKQWTFAIDPQGKDYRAGLQRLARELECAFLDMTAHWGRYIREAGKDLDWFQRDPVHANERGEQILGRILARYLSP